MRQEIRIPEDLMDLEDQREQAMANFIDHCLIASTLPIEKSDPTALVKNIANIMHDAAVLMGLGVFTPEALDSELMKED